MEKVDESNSKVIEEHWDDFAEAYEKMADLGTVQPAVILYNMTKSAFADRVLEVASGTGRSARTFVASYMKNGAV